MTRVPSFHWSCAALLILATACGDDGVPVGESGDSSTGESDTIDGTITLTTTQGPTDADSESSAADTTGPAAVCGDGEIGGDEACDGDALGGQSCESQGLGAGVLACADDCTFDTSGCPECGNNLVEGIEECDGTDLGLETCISMGFDAGQVACYDECTYDTRPCQSFTCGDGQINGTDECEITELGGATCEGAGFGDGEVTCTGRCQLDFTGCCGDGVLGGDEVCDGEDFGGLTCADYGPLQGPLFCSATCDAIDTGSCASCGDGVIEGVEDCEGDDLQGNDCTTIPGAYLGGALSCAADCSFDTSQCLGCGNGIVNAGEDCDGAMTGGATCLDLGFTGGVLGCTAECGFDDAACSDLQTYEVEFCRLQFPVEIVEPAGTEVTVYARVYIGGLTDLSGVNDPAEAVFGQVGYGPDGSDPATADGWVWTTAVPNDGYGPGAPGYEMNNDEAMGELVVPEPGEYDFAYRFTGNDGATWLYCDGGDAGSSNGYAAADAGQMTSE